jgi:hypothetical protein
MSSKTGIALKQILDLVGRLDDSPGDETPRERFRQFLRENVQDIGQVRDYIEECLRNKGEQYNRALQDLVNHLGSLLEFKVVFGRYHGAPGQIGFDGHWESETGFNIVIEVKTTETYAIKTSVLMGYINELISDKKIPSWENTLGLYVVGLLDPEIHQFENAILAEKRTHQLRIISVESLISLAEMMNEYDVNHDDILAVLSPSGPKVDPIVDLMSRLVSQPPPEEPSEIEEPSREKEGEASYWISPVRSDEIRTAEETIQRLVVEEKIYAFGERTPGRKHLKPGDWICFYATGKGAIAHAKVKSTPEKKPHPKVRDSEKYPWTFKVSDVKIYMDNPKIIDTDIRSKLDAFQSRDPNKPWGWFVQATRKISEHDFNILIRQ